MFLTNQAKQGDSDISQNNFNKKTKEGRMIRNRPVVEDKKSKRKKTLLSL